MSRSGEEEFYTGVCIEPVNCSSTEAIFLAVHMLLGELRSVCSFSHSPTRLQRHAGGQANTMITKRKCSIPNVARILQRLLAFCIVVKSFTKCSTGFEGG